MNDGQNTDKANILITGGTGFLGRRLISGLCAGGYAVRALVRNADSRNLDFPPEVTVYEGDILDILSLERAMQGVEQVVHAAATVSFWRKKRAEMRQVNIHGTANVVNCALDAGIKRLVHISSNGVFGGPPGLFVDETWRKPPGKGHTYYGKTKYYAELEVYRGEAEGLPVVILNPGVILGPGDWSSGPPKIFRVVHQGLRFYNRGSASVVGIEDVLQAVRMALQGQLPKGERYLLVAETLPQRELLGAIARHLGKQPPDWPLPRWVSLAVGVISEVTSFFSGKEPIISLETMRSATRTTQYNSGKIAALGLNFTPIETVIGQTAEAFLRDHSA